MTIITLLAFAIGMTIAAILCGPTNAKETKEERQHREQCYQNRKIRLAQERQQKIELKRQQLQQELRRMQQWQEEVQLQA